MQAKDLGQHNACKSLLMGSPVCVHVSEYTVAQININILDNMNEFGANLCHLALQYSRTKCHILHVYYIYYMCVIYYTCNYICIVLCYMSFKRKQFQVQ